VTLATSNSAARTPSMRRTPPSVPVCASNEYSRLGRSTAMTRVPARMPSGALQ
jgi:hypothetical protein